MKTTIWILTFVIFVLVFLVGVLVSYIWYQQKRTNDLELQIDRQDELMDYYKETIDENQKLIIYLIKDDEK